MANNNIAFFPYAAPNDLGLSVASDNATTNLAADVGTSDVSISVVSDALFSVPGLIVIGSEIILVTAKSSNTFTCVRGFSQTTPATHSTGESVDGLIVAYHHNQVAAEIKSLGNYVFDDDFSGFQKSENLLSYSELFSNGYWTKSSGVAINSSIEILPNGSVASTLLEGNSLGLNKISATPVGITGGQVYTFSVYAKYTTSPWLVIGQRVEGSENNFAWFNVQTGLLGTIGSGAKAAIIPVLGGWYRLMVVLTSTSNSYKAFDICIAPSNGNFEYLGTATNDVVLCGAQVQTGDLTSNIPYVKTIGSTVSIIGSNIVLDEGDLS